MWEATPEQARGSRFSAFVHHTRPKHEHIISSFTVAFFKKTPIVFTGKGISYVVEELFQESLGMRPDAAHVLVLITDGRAQDNVVPPSRIARALGQYVCFF